MVSQLDDDYPTSNSAILTEDDELVKTLNVVHVDMYKAKLRERERRKKVSRDHSLICKPIFKNFSTHFCANSNFFLLFFS